MTAGDISPPRTVVLVSGSGTNLQAIIDQVKSGRLGIELIGVVSDRPGAFALERAQRAGIATHTVDFRSLGDREAFTARLSELLGGIDAQLVVLAGFMRILPAPLVDRYRGRMLNVHPSLLPKYPGLETYRRALADGERWHGSTVHFVTPELDAGPGIIQYRVPVREAETEASLRQRVQRGEHIIYPKALDWLASGRLQFRSGSPWLDGRELLRPEVILETPDPDRPPSPPAVPTPG